MNEDKLKFDHYGFVDVKQAFDKETIATIKADMIEEVKDIQYEDVAKVVWNELVKDHQREWVSNPKIVSKLKEVRGYDVEFLSFKPVIKTEEFSYASPWHQDYAYWGGSPKTSVWIALDDATVDNGCLRVIPGSHKEVVEHKNIPGRFGNRLEDVDEKLAINVEMKAGDVLIFSDLLLHSSNPNTSGKDRWSMIPTYRQRGVKDSSEVWKSWHPL